MNFEHQFHILLRISCWTSVGASALRLCSLISIYRKGPQPLGPSRTLSMTYHYSFLLIASIHAILFLSIALAFGVVAEVEQRSRPSIAFGSVVLLSMTGQVKLPLSAKISMTDSTSAFGLADYGIRVSRLSIHWFYPVFCSFAPSYHSWAFYRWERTRLLAT